MANSLHFLNREAIVSKLASLTFTLISPCVYQSFFFFFDVQLIYNVLVSGVSKVIQ